MVGNKYNNVIDMKGCEVEVHECQGVCEKIKPIKIYYKVQIYSKK
jgi:hypothetical protein